MVHFSGTEGKEEIKWLWDEGQERGPRKTPAGQTASPNQTCSTIAGCPERNSENGADSSSEPLSKPPPPPPSLHTPKKKKEQNIPWRAYLSGRGADRAALAQPHVDDPQDTDLQGQGMERKLSSGQDPVILEPKVQAKGWNKH